MFNEQPMILSSELEPTDDSGGVPEPPRFSLKKILLIAALAGAVILLALGLFFAVKKYWPVKNQPSSTGADLIPAATNTPATETPAILPGSEQTETATTTGTDLSGLAIEYLSFADFYKAPNNQFTPQINDYKLPLNVKIDVMNYYDVSRKLNLDPGLESLSNYGFALVDNPWPKEAPDFYSLYGQLDNKQVPILITSDFLVYYYQNILKKIFKDTEENVFYDNLWEINKELYTAAKNRYEARLASIGNVNDSILEGERLETAFFAVALNLLKPAINQISASGTTEKDRFSASEGERFYFTVPPYLRDDVLAEEKLIREGAKDQAKSPVLLYNRNYKDFTVPADYRSNAKLNNFYLTTKWLNSVWPLNYRDKNCPDCLLDAADWRINLTAVSLIAQDFSSLSELKNKWARIYKVMSFFKGLRDDLNYVHYRDSLNELFGPDYKIEELFGDQNKAAAGNLEKLRVKLLAYEFPEISGGLAKNDLALRARLGFKMLAEPYWPNDYLFSRLTVPAVDTYLGTSTKANNVTACSVKKTVSRCNGFALDVIGLIYPLSDNAYFEENTNYSNYEREAARLRDELNKNQVWHLSNYWSNLNLLKISLEANKSAWPVFAHSSAWQDKSLATAVGAWINLQLPLEKYEVSQPFSGQNFNNFSRWNENSYVEPNLSLINELMADSDMIIGMFSALRLETEVRPAWQEIKNFSVSLGALKQIIIKELTGETLAAADNELVADFIKQLKTDPATPAVKQLDLRSAVQKTGLREDLSRLKLLVLTHQEGDNKIFSIGPVWDYQESR